VSVVPIIGVISLVLISSLPVKEWIRFVAGLVIYFLYSRRHSRLATKRDAGS
jgi:APA family basic amino acid/polyamine antiporter